jgi:hypothetical protein
MERTLRSVVETKPELASLGKVSEDVLMKGDEQNKTNKCSRLFSLAGLLHLERTKSWGRHSSQSKDGFKTFPDR